MTDSESIGAGRILAHAPRGRDADVVCQVLEAPFGRPTVCASLADLVAALDAGADIAFVTEESLAGPDFAALARWVDEQPPWSDFPFVVLTARRVGRRPNDATGALRSLGNVVLLERPLNAETLVTAARSALRARARQYETQRHIGRQQRLEEEREALLVAERDARLAAERAGRMKDDFLATLSHELRTPLSAILGWTHLLAHPAATPADVAKAAATIDRNARAQASLIEDLLDVSRITSGRFQLDPRPVSADAIFDAVVQTLKPAADAKGIVVERAPDSAAVEIQVDAGRMQQVVWNLVSNAIKFTPRGGSVTLRAAIDDGEATLTVADNGAGIAPEFLPHVFERFRQADSSEARSVGGLGLGLAIVRQLVELHGGRVQALSPGLGGGSTFVVRLPLPAEARADPVGGEWAAGDGSNTPSDLSGLRILVVEDEDDNRDTLTRILEGHGAEVRATASADEAMAALSATMPDLVISDVGMPRVDGYELMRRIRGLDAAAARDVPSIALTAFARPEDAARARDAGFGRHLAKPFEPAVLVATVAAVVGRSERAS